MRHAPCRQFIAGIPRLIDRFIDCCSHLGTSPLNHCVFAHATMRGEVANCCISHLRLHAGFSSCCRHQASGIRSNMLQDTVYPGSSPGFRSDTPNANERTRQTKAVKAH